MLAKYKLDVKKAYKAFEGAEIHLRNVASLAEKSVKTKTSSNGCLPTIYLRNAVKSSRVREVNISNSDEKQLEFSIKCN